MAQAPKLDPVKPAIDEMRMIVDEQHEAQRRAVADADEALQLGIQLYRIGRLQFRQVMDEIDREHAHHVGAQHLRGRQRDPALRDG